MKTDQIPQYNLNHKIHKDMIKDISIKKKLNLLIWYRLY